MTILTTRQLINHFANFPAVRVGMDEEWFTIHTITPRESVQEGKVTIVTLVRADGSWNPTGVYDRDLDVEMWPIA